MPTNTARSPTPYLPPHIKDLYLKSLTNPYYLTELVGMAFKAVERGEDWPSHPSILRLHARQLDDDVPASGHISAALPALSALGGFGCAIQTRNSLGVKAFLESVWPKAWKWVDAVARGFGRFEIPRFHQLFHTVYMSIGSIMVLLVAESPSLTVLYTEGLLRLVLELYTFQCHHHIGPFAEASNFPSFALSALLASPSTDFHEVHQVLGWKPTKAAIAFCAPLKRATDPKSNWNLFLTNVSDVHGQLLFRNPSFYTWLSPKIVITAICDALWTTLTSTIAHRKGDVVNILLRILEKYGRCTNGDHSWMIHALRARLIPSLLLAEVYGPRITSSIRKILFHLFSYSFYPIFLRRVAREMPTGDVIETLPFTHDIWSRFLTKSTTLCDLLEEFNESYGYVPQCVNSECAKAPGSWTERRCSGCKTAIYCSKECQRVNWPSHRDVCKTCRPQRDVLTSPRCTAFLKFVTLRDLRFYRFNILQLQISSNVPPPAILRNDFTKNPKFTFHPVDSQVNVQFFVGPGNLKRQPRLIPSIKIPAGPGKSREFVIQTDVSGELFGWCYDDVEEKGT